MNWTILIVLILCSILVLNCGQNSLTAIENRKKVDTGYATELINNDFLKYADSSTIGYLKSQLLDSFNIYEDKFFRLVHVDAEELSEFSFDFFLPELNKILAKRDIVLSVKTLKDTDTSFNILINDDTLQLYTREELNKNEFWDSGPRNFFRKTNEILKKKNRDEKFYLLYGGNDLHAFLLTDKQFSIIADYYKNKPKEMPYAP